MSSVKNFHANNVKLTTHYATNTFMNSLRSSNGQVKYDKFLNYFNKLSIKSIY